MVSILQQTQEQGILGAGIAIYFRCVVSSLISMPQWGTYVLSTVTILGYKVDLERSFLGPPIHGSSWKTKISRNPAAIIAAPRAKTPTKDASNTKQGG